MSYTACKCTHAHMHTHPRLVKLVASLSTRTLAPFPSLDKACDMWSAGVVLYIMCCGYPPFRSDQRSVPMSSAMKQRIRTGTFAFHDEYWKDVSEDAKELIRQLLEVNALKRLNAQQLRSHRWVAGDDVKAVPLKTPRELVSSAGEKEENAEMINQELADMRTHTDVRLKNTVDLSKNKLLARRNKRSPKLKLTAPGSTAAPAVDSQGFATPQ
eukprot:TRINITY_DN7563_c0_g1_i5.p2 TRINITY_DN7563_c0_g1~~TRINITY_DN7563_c0_g1_i5.p2  ORF type:complete len:213 (+),score=35.85 TRINITY_DN7563_c0_g1_i5:861-1499(+)